MLCLFLTGECSGTLLSLLAAISPKLDSTMPAALVGHIIMSAVTGRATLLQLVLSVLLNQQRQLVDHFHKFGVTTSYDELRRFRISAATSVAKDAYAPSKFNCREDLVQVVADNFDT